MKLTCHNCGKSAAETKFAITAKSSCCPNCGHRIEYYDAKNPPVIPDKFRAEICQRFMREASAGECLFQFFWSHRFEYSYQSQIELFA